MFVAQVSFARDVSQDAITELLGTWWNIGQVVSHEYAIATTSPATALSLRRMCCSRTGDYHRIMTWRADYHACDTLQMNCQTLESAATAKLSDLDRSLTKRGRALCASITSSTGVPTLYYVYGYRSALECPSCSRPWRLSELLMRIFDCRCDDCHLLSNVD